MDSALSVLRQLRVGSSGHEGSRPRATAERYVISHSRVSDAKATWAPDKTHNRDATFQMASKSTWHVACLALRDTGFSKQSPSGLEAANLWPIPAEMCNFFSCKTPFPACDSKELAFWCKEEHP